jgi:hypothetical protein
MRILGSREAEASHQSLDSLASSTQTFNGDHDTAPTAQPRAEARRRLRKASSKDASASCGTVQLHPASTASSESECGVRSPREVSSPTSQYMPPPTLPIDGSAQQQLVGDDSDVVVFASKPLFQQGPQSAACALQDALALLWAFISHLVVTAWPYTSLLICAGALFMDTACVCV